MIIDFTFPALLYFADVIFIYANYYVVNINIIFKNIWPYVRYICDLVYCIIYSTKKVKTLS